MLFVEIPVRKMFPTSNPTLFRVGEGGIVFYAEQYLEMRRYVYIISLSKNLLSLIVCIVGSNLIQLLEWKLIG
jgi:hypothetical protein